MILVRHASAGDPATWVGPDRLRPLDRKGEHQARALVAALDAYPISAIFTSPATRCVETVRPLAEARGLELVVREELGEERFLGEGGSVVRELAASDAVLCSHGGIESSLAGAPRLHKGEAFVVDASRRVVEKFRP